MAEQRLLRRYLHTFGPATLSDFAYWVGMTHRDAQTIWAREQSNLTPVNVDGTTAAISRGDARALSEARPIRPPVRLLPYFDAYLLGHKERSHIVPLGRLRTIYRPQGWVVPVVLVDGRVAGSWALAREGRRLSVAVTPFATLSRSIRTAIDEEADDLGRFLGATGADLRIR